MGFQFFRPWQGSHKAPRTCTNTRHSNCMGATMAAEKNFTLILGQSQAFLDYCGYSGRALPRRRALVFIIDCERSLYNMTLISDQTSTHLSGFPRQGNNVIGGSVQQQFETIPEKSPSFTLFAVIGMMLIGSQYPVLLGMVQAFFDHGRKNA